MAGIRGGKGAVTCESCGASGKHTNPCFACRPKKPKPLRGNPKWQHPASEETKVKLAQALRKLFSNMDENSLRYLLADLANLGLSGVAQQNGQWHCHMPQPGWPKHMALWPYEMTQEQWESSEHEISHYRRSPCQ